VSRVCLDMLRTRMARREDPLDVHVPDPVVTSAADDPEQHALLADSVGLALLVVLDTLSPAERLAFVLHDIFAVPFDEIAAILERSPAASRQLASRARRRVQGATPPPNADPGRQRQIVDAFLAALRNGDFEALVAVLDPEVLLRDDSAGLPGGAAELRGAPAVGRYALGFSRSAQFVEPALVDGAAGLAIVPQGRIMGALGFTFSGGKITGIDMVSEPGRLQEVDLAAAGP